MRLVVDANILFAALIRNSITRHMLLLLEHELYAPEYLIDEINEHINEVEMKTGLPKKEIRNLLDALVTNAKITLVPTTKFKSKLFDAETLSSDPDDLPYLALALQLSCPIWSSDKRLKDQKKVRIIITDELIRNASF